MAAGTGQRQQPEGDRSRAAAQPAAEDLQGTLVAQSTPGGWAEAASAEDLLSSDEYSSMFDEQSERSTAASSSGRPLAQPQSLAGTARQQAANQVPAVLLPALQPLDYRSQPAAEAQSSLPAAHPERAAEPVTGMGQPSAEPPSAAASLQEATGTASAQKPAPPPPAAHHVPAGSDAAVSSAGSREVQTAMTTTSQAGAAEQAAAAPAPSNPPAADVRQPAAGSASKLERLTNKISDAIFEDQLAAAMSGKLGAHGALASDIWPSSMRKEGHAQQASWELAGWPCCMGIALPDILQQHMRATDKQWAGG